MTLTRYSNDELLEFKSVVDVRLNETIREYNAVVWQLQQPEETEESSIRKDLLYTRAARLKRNVDNLRSALLRLENKTYGICIITGTLIPKQRLLAVPHTTINTEAPRPALRA